ncbi:vacuolar sorting protein 39/Transforming growth factor beta receptor-associated domain 1-containing protein, partial [Phakopsora pachyrhizi]
IIDTSLFKCYLAIKPAMLGPLCRLLIWCKSDEVETLLTEAKHHCKLLDLYHGKSQHDQALKLL